MRASYVSCSTWKESKSPVEQGMKVVSIVAEMTHSEAYLDSVSGSQELKERVLHIGTKTPDEPDLLYEVKANEDADL